MWFFGTSVTIEYYNITFFHMDCNDFIFTPFFIKQTQNVNIANGSIQAKKHTRFCLILSYRIPTQPPSNLRLVLPHLVLVQSCHKAPGLGAEAMGEGGGEFAGLDQRLTEGGVVVVRDYLAIGGDVLGDIAVGVVGGEIE